MRSAGRVLVIGSADAGRSAPPRCSPTTSTSPCCCRTPAATWPQARTLPVHTGKPTRIAGWLGAFEVTWTRANPIDADLCTRCNACIEVCPEQAIDFSYQIDLAKCTGHRDCVRACGAAAAIDFERAAEEQSERFDLVLDLQAVPQIALHQPPQGYFHAADDAGAVRRRAAPARQRRRVREAEVLRLQAEDLRAHAQRPDRLHRVHRRLLGGGDPQRCAAKGRTAARRHRRRAAPVRRLRRLHDGVPERRADVCDAAPERARHAHPHAARDLRARRRPRRGVADPQRRTPAPARSTRSAAARASIAAVHGVPARVLPLEVWHTASVGIDLWLAAIAYGAAQVWVLVTDEEAPDVPRGDRGADGGRAGDPHRPGLRRRALPRSSAPARCRARASASRVGPARASCRRRLGARSGAAALDARCAGRRPTVRRAATFAVQPDKRTTLDLAFEHLLREAPAPADVDRAAGAGGRRARSAPRRRQRHLHAVPGLRRRLPRRRAGRQPRSRRAAASSRRTASSAACARAPAPRTRSRSCRACCSPTAARRAGSRACSTRPSRSAASAAPSRSARCARSSRWSPSWPVTRCSRAARPSGCRCAATAASSTAQRPGRSADHRAVSSDLELGR